MSDRARSAPSLATPAGKELGHSDTRLSVSKCRKFLDRQATSSDERVEAVRDTLYALAELLVAEYLRTRTVKSEPHSALCIIGAEIADSELTRAA